MGIYNPWTDTYTPDPSPDTPLLTDKLVEAFEQYRRSGLTWRETCDCIAAHDASDPFVFAPEDSFRAWFDHGEKLRRELVELKAQLQAENDAPDSPIKMLSAKERRWVHDAVWEWERFVAYKAEAERVRKTDKPKPAPIARTRRVLATMDDVEALRVRIDELERLVRSLGGVVA